MTPSKRAVAFIALLVLLMPLLMAQGSGRANFGWVIANRATIQDGGLTVLGDSALSGTTTAGNIVAEDVDFANVDVDGYVMATDVMVAPSAVVTVTNHGTFTPQDSFHPIAAAGAVAVNLGTCPNGQITVIENTVNQTITISDTVRLAGSFAMGQWDSLTVIGDGTGCLELSRSNN